MLNSLCGIGLEFQVRKILFALVVDHPAFVEGEFADLLRPGAVRLEIERCPNRLLRALKDFPEFPFDLIRYRDVLFHIVVNFDFCCAVSRLSLPLERFNPVNFLQIYTHLRT